MGFRIRSSEAGESARARRPFAAFTLLLTLCAHGGAGAQEPAPGARDPAASDAGPAAPLEPSAEATPLEPSPELASSPESGATPIPASDPGTDVAPATGALEGRVLDARSGEPVVEATVFVESEGDRRRAFTDLDGRFSIELPPGLWRVRSFADFYREARHRPVRVRAGQAARVVIRLREGSDEHLVYEVVETADRRNDAVLNQARMESTTAQDTMGGQAMARQGASNAARAASRVVGASLEGNTLIVRGLADRYVTVLMNGVLLPGTDPDRNGVALDVIPAAVISNISVVKTFQPELPANWAGGLMQIESQGMPEDFTVRASVSFAANTRATFRDNLDYAGGRGDFLGFGLRARALPAAVPDHVARAGTVLADGTIVTDAEASAVGRSFRDDWQTSREFELPNGTLAFSIGNMHELSNDRRIGYLTGINYSRSVSRRDTVQRLLNSTTNIASEFQSEQTTEEVLLTAFATGSFRYSRAGDLRLLSMYTQHASDDTRFQYGNENDNSAYVERWQLQYVQRSVIFNQLVGEQRQIPWFTDEGARLRYSLYVAQSRRDEPDTRQVRYEREDDQPTDPLRLTESPNGSDVLNFDLDQLDAGGYAHFRFPLFRGDEREGNGEIGVDVRVSRRTSYYRQFHFQPVASADPALLEQEANVVLADENINGIPGPIRFREVPFAQNSYSGASQWVGAYVTTDLKLASWLRFAGGVRLESMAREVEIERHIDGLPMLPSGTQPRVSSEAVDFLPAATFIASPRDSMNIRLSYGYTVVHPQFREFAPVNYYDFARRRQISGTPGLRRTHIHNLDARWEWLTNQTGGLFAVSAFYKRFVNPIERTNASAGSRDLEYSNADGGFNLGTEVEARLTFGQWDEAENWLDWFSLSGNLSLVYSRVVLSDSRADAQPDRTRPMFFQSPYVANLSLGFDHTDSGLTVTLAYNSVGSRIVEVGAVNSGEISPNIIESPFHSLDLIGSYQMHDHWRLTWAIKNMLGWERTQRAGQYVIEQYNPGTEVGVGIGYSN